jgi:hypothetical protein
MTIETERYKKSSQIIICFFLLQFFRANKKKYLHKNFTSIAWLKLSNFGRKKEIRGVLANKYVSILDACYKIVDEE